MSSANYRMALSRERGFASGRACLSEDLGLSLLSCPGLANVAGQGP